jgi:hypothetical protein
MQTAIDFDVDIDVADRSELLKCLNYTSASIQTNDGLVKHNTGIYLQNIPMEPLAGHSAIDHKSAEQEGYFKVDILNNSVYKGVRNSAHLDTLMEKEPLWELLEHQEVVEQLFHINKYHWLLSKYKPKSIDQLAMILALIRPSKKHLMGESWETIGDSIWTKPKDNSYYFKKSHAVAYAMVIVVQLNLLCEQLTQVDV